jgi:hypothetical protein
MHFRPLTSCSQLGSPKSNRGKHFPPCPILRGYTTETQINERQPNFLYNEKKKTPKAYTQLLKPEFRRLWILQCTLGVEHRKCEDSDHCSARRCEAEETTALRTASCRFVASGLNRNIGAVESAVSERACLGTSRLRRPGSICTAARLTLAYNPSEAKTGPLTVDSLLTR